jgi:type I restriction enzyme S subunit
MQNDCFSDTPLEWTKGPISMIADINPRYPVKKGQNLPFIEMAAVAEQFDGIKRIDWRTLEGSGLARFKVGDTLFAKITPCPENGKVAFIHELPATYGIGSTEFIVLSPRSNCDPHYLYHLVCAHAIRGRAASRMEGSTGRQRVPDDVFEKRLLVPVPPPEEQFGIAQVLDAADKAIQTTRIAAERARDLDHSLLHDLLEKGIAGRHRKGKPNWSIHRLDEVAEVGSGVTLGKDVSGFKTVELPYLRVANVQDGHLDLSTIKTVRVRVEDSENYRLEPGDVLMTEGGDLDKLGRGTIWHGEIPDCLHQNHIFRIRANQDQLRPYFFALVVESDIAKRYFMRVAKRTTNLASINKTVLRAFRFPVPEPTEQEEIENVMKAIKATVKTLSDKENALRRLKNALMHDLLTGAIRVKTSHPRLAEAV